MVVVAICRRLQIDLTVVISIPTYRCVCTCSFDQHCVSVEQSLLSGDLPPLGFGGPHLSVTLIQTLWLCGSMGCLMPQEQCYVEGRGVVCFLLGLCTASCFVLDSDIQVYFQLERGIKTRQDSAKPVAPFLGESALRSKSCTWMLHARAHTASTWWVGG